MRQIIRPVDMGQLEQRAFSQGTKSLDVMERAARRVVDALLDMLGTARGKQVGFFCGPGNNGGDGLAAARLFAQQGGSAHILMLAPPATPDTRHNLARAQALGIPIARGEAWPPMDAAVDALFGIGLDRPLSGAALAVVERLNALRLPVLSVDIPSGLHALTGAGVESCVKATVTLAFAYTKPGHYLNTAPEVVGSLRVADIGIRMEEGHSLISCLDAQDLPPGLPRRSRAAHKGSHGRAMLYCGSLGMAGAAALAGMGCLRAGAGLTRFVCHEAIIPILQVLVPNAQCSPIHQALVNPPQHDVLLAGCGLGQSDDTWQNLMQLYQPQRPTVLDADALNLLAQHPMRLGPQTLLTPHVAEAARLLHCTTQQVLADMLAAADAIHQRYGAVVLLKSHCSVITDGSRTALNTLGSPVLAKGGSGDGLAGIITGLMAQGLPAYDAACLGSLWMGRAAQLAEKRFGLHSALTGEVLSLMGEAAGA